MRVETGLSNEKRDGRARKGTHWEATVLVSDSSGAAGFPRLQWSARQQRVAGISDSEWAASCGRDGHVQHACSIPGPERGKSPGLPTPWLFYTPHTRIIHDCFSRTSPAACGKTQHKSLASKRLLPWFQSPSQLHLVSQPEMPPQTKLPFSAVISPDSGISSLTLAEQSLPEGRSSCHLLSQKHAPAPGPAPSLPMLRG